jgi:hypothetical protein
MSLAYKYVKRKRNERQAAPSQHNESGSSARPATTDFVAAADAQPSDPAEGNAATEKTDPSPEEVAEKKRRRKYRWKIVIGLFAPFALQALDTTIIASAMPYIATDFSTYQSGPLLSANEATNDVQTRSNKSIGSSRPSISPRLLFFSSGRSSPISLVGTLPSMPPFSL